MLIDTAPPRVLGLTEDPVLRIDRENPPEIRWPGRRLMFLRDEPAFEMSHWCGTCAFLFRRLKGANETLSLPEMEDRLRDGLDTVDDDVVETFGKLLPHGRFQPMLLSIQPRLCLPGHVGDYFNEEQRATWGLNQFTGLCEYPETPYYRTWQTAVDDDDRMYEFVVPMVPPTWNDPTKVEEYEQLLTDSDAPTAVALTILDMAQPAMTRLGSTDYYEHWCLTHFLLDGHHKVQAAQQSEKPIRLLSLLALDHGVATVEAIERVPELRSQPVS